MKLRPGAAGIGALALLTSLAGSGFSGCLVPVDSSEDEAGNERVGAAPSALDNCTHAFLFSPAPTQCNDDLGKGAKIRAGTDKVPATGCEVVDIETYSSSCEAKRCGELNKPPELPAWPLGHDDQAHLLAAEKECTRICEAPERNCTSLGVAVRSLSAFAPFKASQCWDGLSGNTSCGIDPESPEENPADWVMESPCVALIGASCGTAVQRHDTYACLCQAVDGGLGDGGNPVGGPGAGAPDPGCHCQLGAPIEGGVGGLVAMIAAVALGARRGAIRARGSRAARAHPSG